MLVTSTSENLQTLKLLHVESSMPELCSLTPLPVAPSIQGSWKPHPYSYLDFHITDSSSPCLTWDQSKTYLQRCTIWIRSAITTMPVPFHTISIITSVDFEHFQFFVLMRHLKEKLIPADLISIFLDTVAVFVSLLSPSSLTNSLKYQKL